MLARLVYNVGVAALVAGLTVMVGGVNGRGPDDSEYLLTIKKQADGTYHLDPKPSRFSLKFHGQVRWDVYNASGDEIEFKMNGFDKYAGDCPLDFLGNTGNTQLCVGTIHLSASGPGQQKPIKAKRHRSDAYSNQVFKFKTVVNDTEIDPEIEIERDPYSFFNLSAIAGGLLTAVVGWYLLRRQRLSAR